MMIKSSTTRYYLVVHLAILFIVFSVGLPIIVASCPMAQNSQRPVCNQCLPASGGQSASIVKYIDRSCCATVFAASRNMTEFTRSGSDHARLLATVVLPLPTAIAMAAPVRDELQNSTVDPVVPLRVDIPLFVSSLLI